MPPRIATEATSPRAERRTDGGDHPEKLGARAEAIARHLGWDEDRITAELGRLERKLNLQLPIFN